VKVLRAIQPILSKNVLLGQYVSANGKPGYLDDDTVPPNSTCPTFAATTLWINNPRWEGVPFILKAGKGKDIFFAVVMTQLVDLTMCLRFKALNDAKVEVRIQFKDVTSGIFKDVCRNELVLRIQPSESVYLKLNTKLPGLYTRAIPTEMDLTYKRRFVESKIPEAYEALILDAIKGDHSNFVRRDELEHAWKVSIPSSWSSSHDAKLNSHVPRV
jgi:glucose-6-phosphate 1-dehydrogenase